MDARVIGIALDEIIGEYLSERNITYEQAPPSSSKLFTFLWFGNDTERSVKDSVLPYLPSEAHKFFQTKNADLARFMTDCQHQYHHRSRTHSLGTTWSMIKSDAFSLVFDLFDLTCMENTRKCYYRPSFHKNQPIWRNMLLQSNDSYDRKGIVRDCHLMIEGLVRSGYFQSL